MISFVDQTPTPTKFLKNCEEIGLFQELSKNPFEEAFKKASDVPEGPLTVRAGRAHGATGRRIDPSWRTLELFLIPAIGSEM